MKNLIGISGHMGSGKDTVGSIIQALTGTGFGDNEVFETFKKTGLIPISTDQSPFIIKKFADKLKDIVCMLIGCTREQLEDSVFKNTPMNSDWDNSHGISTPRELLQILGTDCGRDMIHKNIWVNALFADYKSLTYEASEMAIKEGKPAFEIIYPQWIITDMRFPNELEAIQKKGGITIRVNRPTIYATPKDNSEFNNQELAKFNHPSETALDDYLFFDYTIDNKGTMSDLIEEVRRILIAEKII
jgi:hypothetical protein